MSGVELSLALSVAGLAVALLVCVKIMSVLGERIDIASRRIDDLQKSGRN